MGYCVIYSAKAIEKPKNENKINDVMLCKHPCFSGIYTHIYNYKTIDVYVLKSYKDDGDDNSMNYSEKEVKDYVKILNRFSNCIKLDCNAKYRDNDAYLFKIINLQSIKTKIILNFIRYLHEESFTGIPKTVLEISKDLRYLNVYNKLLLGNFKHLNVCGSGHDIYSYKVHKELTKDEQDKLFKAEELSTSYISTILPKTKVINNKLKDNIMKVKKPKEIYKLYKDYINEK